MDITKGYTSIAAAARDYFGPNGADSSAASWMREWKALTDADKAEIGEGLTKLGYSIAQK